MKPWKYKEVMSFLLFESTPRETYTYVNHYDGNDTVADLKDEENQIIEKHSQNDENVELALSYNIESETQKKKHNYDANKKNIGKESDVDKIISFIGNKNQVKKQPRELDFFFTSACENTKRLPRRLQLQIKQEVMRTFINAEIEFLDQPSTTPTSSIISTETPGCSRLDTPSTGSYKKASQYI
uniref:BESS domain-containing protein n=1 Tax=Sipha flava TaxID=143950 RepID=A0A2S2Q5C2_9HEMI